MRPYVLQRRQTKERLQRHGGFLLRRRKTRLQRCCGYLHQRRNRQSAGSLGGHTARPTPCNHVESAWQHVLHVLNDTLTKYTHNWDDSLQFKSMTFIKSDFWGWGLSVRPPISRFLGGNSSGVSQASPSPGAGPWAAYTIQYMIYDTTYTKHSITYTVYYILYATILLWLYYVLYTTYYTPPAAWPPPRRTAGSAAADPPFGPSSWRPISVLVLRFWISEGFDSSRILILRGGTPRPKGNFPEILSQQILEGQFLVGRLGVLWRWEPYQQPNTLTPRNVKVWLLLFQVSTFQWFHHQ